MTFKILIIEDELNLQETLKLNLELEGYRVETLSTGLNAMAHIRTSAPDLILLDIMLPILSGTEIYRELKKTEQ